MAMLNSCKERTSSTRISVAKDAALVLGSCTAKDFQQCFSCRLAPLADSEIRNCQQRFAYILLTVRKSTWQIRKLFFESYILR